MEIGGISSEYFDTKGYFKNKDRQLRQKGYVVDRYGQPIRKKKVKSKISLQNLFFIIVSVAVAIALFVILLLLNLDVLTWGYSTLCPEGFDLANCERMDFLDTYLWQDYRMYRIGQEQCRYGVAFRTWAPLVSSVDVIISNGTGVREYPMIKQYDGCWFVNVCNVNVDDNYHFRYVSSDSQERCSRLSLGSKEVLFYGQADETNRVTSTVYAERLSLFNIREGIVYQVFIPSFLDGEESEYFLRQMTDMITYIAGLGVNTIELFPIEQYNCGVDGTSLCWREVSIQIPGVVHQHFGTITQLREFVIAAHNSGLRVLLDVNWSFSDASSLLYDIECNGSWGSFFHSEGSAQNGGRRQIDLGSMKQSGNYVRKIIQQWRDETGIDGIVWLESNCLFYIGQSCHEGYGSFDDDAYSLLQSIVDSSDFLHIGDEANSITSSVFSTVYNRSLTLRAQRVLSPDSLQVNTVALFLDELNNARNSIFCFEDRYTSIQRFIGRTPSVNRLRMQAIGLGIMTLAPTIPCLFMGTEFFTEQAFTDTPESLDWSFLTQRDDHYGFYLMSQALMELRAEFPLHEMQFAVHWMNTDRGLLTLSVEQGRSVLFAVINLSLISVSESEAIPLPSFLVNTLIPKFSSESSTWCSQFGDESNNVRVTSCPDEETKSCMFTSVHYYSVRIFEIA